MRDCPKCHTDHDGYEPGTYGAEVRCLRLQAEALGAGHLVDQLDTLERERLRPVADVVQQAVAAFEKAHAAAIAEGLTIEAAVDAGNRAYEAALSGSREADDGR